MMMMMMIMMMMMMMMMMMFVQPACFYLCFRFQFESSSPVLYSVVSHFRFQFSGVAITSKAGPPLIKADLFFWFDRFPFSA